MRYSRKAVLFGLLGAGALVGFRNPVELPTQGPEGTSGAGSPDSESTAKSVQWDRKSNDESKNESKDDSSGDGDSGKGQSESEQEEGVGDEGQDNVEEEPKPPNDPTMQMYVPRLGIRGHTVREGDSEEILALGAMKLPSTGNPWQDGANTYVSGHRIGYPGRESYYQFYNLPAMRIGDAVFLRDANGTLYEYRVSEKFAVSPSESWVTEPIAGEDLVTLQTCVDSVARSTWWEITPKLMAAGPDTGRLIVRAKRVNR